MTIELSKPEKSEYWSIVDGDGNILDSGRLTPDLVLTTNNPTIVHDQNQNQYLNSINGIGAAGLPLPDAGTELTAGEIYAWENQNVIVRQDHVRTEHDPDTVPALFSVYREATDGMVWIPNEQVLVGDERKYPDIETGDIYECIQSHQTQEDWTPDATPTLWQMAAPEPGAEWAYPVGYNVGDEVIYLGVNYVCLQAHTSQAAWTPLAVASLWSPA